jgi:AcrR family transcriptional regulator
MTEKRARRTQVERSASTREALLKATIKSLYEHGYGATTTTMVADEANVSRGAMLHQFPSKADLMIYVVEQVFDEAVTIYRELLAGIVNPRDRLVSYPQAVWKVDSRPAGIAALEILQGSRSDAELAAKLRPVEAGIKATAIARLSQEFPRPPSPALLHLIVGAVRGLAITQMLTPEENVAEAIELLQRLLQGGLEAGVLSGSDSAKSAKRATRQRQAA